MLIFHPCLIILQIAVTMEATAFGEIIEVASQVNYWTTPPVPVNVYTSIDSPANAPMMVDLISTLGHSQVNWARSRESFINDCYWLPPDISSNSTEKRNNDVVSYLFNKTVNSGFNLVTKGSDSRQKTGLYRLDLCCQMGLKFRESKNRKMDTRVYSERLNSEPCPFQFVVYFDPESGRWLLPKKQAGCASHRGHCQLAPHEVKIRRSVIDPIELKLVHQQLGLNVSPSTIARLLEKRTGTHYSRDQLRELRKATKLLQLGKKTSPAQRLIDHLRRSDNLSYAALIGHRSSKDLVTIRKSQKRKQDKQETNEDYIVKTDPGVDNAKTFAESVMDALELGDKGEILLCVAWMTDDGRRMFIAHPECFGTDITNGVDHEKRPLLRATGRNAENRNLPFLNAFVASGSRWVHRWIFQDVLPLFLPNDTLEKVRLCVTDDDKQCHLEFIAAVSAGIFPNAMHRLCQWHKVNRNFVLPARSKARNVGQTGYTADQDFIRIVEFWLYSFCKSIETPFEEELSLRSLLKFIQTFEGIKDGLRGFTHAFVNGPFKDALPKLCHRHYMFLPQGSLRANSFSEAENSALNRDPCGVGA